MKRAALVGVLLLAALLAGGCSKTKEVIVKTTDGQKLSPADIDRDPSALLPSRAIAVAALDARQLFGSRFGQQLLAVARTRVPIPASAGFDPQRDIERALVGFYSMQGVDFVAVVTGNFDPAAIEQAADGTTNTPLGAPLVKQSYAGRNLYLSRNVGFAVITSRTVLLGNETAIRRALDRMEEGRVARAIPAWFDELAQGQTAPVYGGADFASNALVGPNTDDLPFLEGVETVKMVANFQDPGLNIAGTMSYGSPEAAQTGAASLQQFNNWLQRWGSLAIFIGLTQPIKSLQVQPEGKDAKFVAAVDGAAVTQFLETMADKVPGMLSPTPTAPAPTTPAPPLVPTAPPPPGQ